MIVIMKKMQNIYANMCLFRLGNLQKTDTLIKFSNLITDVTEDSRCWYSGCAFESYDKKVKRIFFEPTSSARTTGTTKQDIRQVAIGRSQALRRETALSGRGGRPFWDPTHAASRAAE